MLKQIEAAFHANAAMCYPWAVLFMQKEPGPNHWDSASENIKTYCKCCPESDLGASLPWRIPSWWGCLGGGHARVTLLGACWMGGWFLFDHGSFVLAFKYLIGVQFVYKAISFFREESCVDGYGFIHVKPLLKGRMVRKEDVKSRLQPNISTLLPLTPRDLILIIHHTSICSLLDCTEGLMIRIHEAQLQLQTWNCPTFQRGKRTDRHIPNITFTAVELLSGTGFGLHHRRKSKGRV